jgi:glutaconate CoA-transferase, subunit A
VIVTAEEIVEEDRLRLEPERNPLPYFVVKHVCHVPFGAHPYAVFNYYDYDPIQLKLYHDAAKEDTAFHLYLDQFVYQVKSFNDYLECVGGAARWESLRAAPEYGYRPDLRRR